MPRGRRTGVLDEAEMPIVAPHGGYVVDATPQQKMRKILMFVTMCAAVAALVAVVAGYGAKHSRVQRAELALANAEVGSSQAAVAYRELKAALARQKMEMRKLTKGQSLKLAKPAITKLDDEEAPAEEDEAATESAVPDPEEAKKKAAEMAASAGDALAKSQADLMKAVDDLVPGGDLLHAFSWHLDLCVYIITMYAVYYVWKTNLWMTILPRMSFNMVKEPELTPRTEARKNRECHIGEWSDQHLEPDEASMPCDHDLLWFRKAKGEVAHFIDAKRVLPGA